MGSMDARCGFGCAGGAGGGGAADSIGEGGAGTAIGGTVDGPATGVLIATEAANGTATVTGGGIDEAADVMVTWAGGAKGGTSVICGRAGSEAVAASGFSPCSSSFLSSNVAIKFRISLTVCLASEDTESLWWR